MSTSVLRDTHRAVKELTEARMDERAAEAVVALVRESITEGCASRSDLTAAMALQKDDLTAAMALQKDDLTKAIAIQKDDLTAAMALQKDDLTKAMALQKDDLTTAMAAQTAKLTKAMATRKVEVDKQFRAIDKQFKAIDERFQGVDQRFNGVDKRFEAMDKRLLVLEERSRTWVTKDALAAALKDERRYTDAQFDRVWGEIKDVGKSVTALHEKMFGRTANSIRIAAALAATLFIALQVYDMFFRV